MPHPPPAPNPESLLRMEPVVRLLKRAKEELASKFDSVAPIRVSRAPGRLDVMGGIAEYTGSLVLESTLECGAAVVLNERSDRLVQIFSFNRFDEHQPFTFGIPLDSLATFSMEKLREEFSEPGRKWAAPLAGCLAVLHESKLVDLNDTKHRGMNLAMCSEIPSGVGLGSNAAVEVATMINLLDHFAIRSKVNPMRMAALCLAVETGIVGSVSGIVGEVSSCSGHGDSLLRLLCQPHEIQKPLHLPRGVRVIGINSSVTRSNTAMYQKTRCAAFMAHTIILNKMQEMGIAMGRPLWGDPMHGYLAKLDPEDYKKIFRPVLPQNMSGQQFLEKFGETIDVETRVSPIEWYHVQNAADHHVLEPRRVRHFAEFVEQAAEPVGEERRKILNKAGHLMYASHLSYSNDAMLSCEECDLLVEMVRERERCGLYGARITAGGGGGTVAVLAEESTGADIAVAEILKMYEDKTGRRGQIVLTGSSGAWHLGTTFL